MKRTAVIIMLIMLLGAGADICADNDEAPASKPMPFEYVKQPPGMEKEAHHHHADMGGMNDDNASAAVAEAGVDEKLGMKAHVNAVFTDAKGSEINLADIVDRPTLLLPVYYHCPSACNIMLGSLSASVDKMPLTPGKEYNIIALSFDDEDTVEWAEKTKKNHLNSITKAFPEEGFRFLVGANENITMVMNGIGYKYKKTGQHMFVHPNAMVVLSKDGTIIRYLYGPSFLPFDIGMALAEAEKGTPGVSIRKLMTYCFDYDPKNKTYVFKAFRITAVSVLFLLFLYFFFVLRKRK